MKVARNRYNRGEKRIVMLFEMLDESIDENGHAIWWLDPVVVAMPATEIRLALLLEVVQQQPRTALRGLTIRNHRFELAPVGFAT